MHSENQIPILRLPAVRPGEPRQPVFVMTTGPEMLSSLPIALFRLELGRDASLYVGAQVDATSISYSEGRKAEGSGTVFHLDEESDVPLDRALQHPYISFHGSGEINHPGKKAMRRGKMTFKLSNTLAGKHQLCLNLIGPPGIYQLAASMRPGIDMIFPGLFDSYPARDGDLIPYFGIDVTRFSGDPSPILEEASKDSFVSFGLLTDLVAPSGSKNECVFFIRVKLMYGKALDDFAWPDGHRIVYSQQS